MRQAVLLGNPGTKRTDYLKKAAEQEHVPLGFLDWREWDGQLPEGESFLKIDPPLWNSWALEELRTLTDTYRKQLAELRQAAEGRKTEFLNTPSVIAELLDKRGCKARLLQAELPVTECLCQREAVLNTEQLLEEMRQRRIYQVFLKPVYGSGAAGVSAFRLQPGTGRMSLYTCASLVPGAGLVNTKQLRNHTDTGEVRRYLDQLLGLDCVVERWYAKAMQDGYAYDLRVVVQEQRMDYILARLSRGPITNLQLNNHPLSVKELGLPVQTLERVEELCRKAVECFPGLESAGIDILLEKGSLKPRIIEMNAQGDLIYQDIYHDNLIYRRQAKRMKAWLSA